VVTGVASLETPVGIGVLHPVLGQALAVIEVVAERQDADRVAAEPFLPL
jgi:hypothetical protein